MTCLQFGGSRIVSGSDDNTLRVWNAITGRVTNYCSLSLSLSLCLVHTHNTQTHTLIHIISYCVYYVPNLLVCTIYVNIKVAKLHWLSYKLMSKRTATVCLNNKTTTDNVLEIHICFCSSGYMRVFYTPFFVSYCFICLSVDYYCPSVVLTESAGHL